MYFKKELHHKLSFAEVFIRKQKVREKNIIYDTVID